MKSILFAGAALMALCTGGHAATLSYTTFTGTGDTFAPDTSSAMNFVAGATTSDATMTSPFGTASTVPYDVVHALGSATFEGDTTGSGSFGTGSGTFNLLWGSPDSYNTLTFLLNGAPIAGATFTGLQVDGGPSSGAYLVSISGLPTYNGVEFASAANAFEFAAVSAVPLPAGLPLFAGAVLALGLVGATLRRGAAAHS